MPRRAFATLGFTLLLAFPALGQPAAPRRRPVHGPDEGVGLPRRVRDVVVRRRERGTLRAESPPEGRAEFRRVHRRPPGDADAGVRLPPGRGAGDERVASLPRRLLGERDSHPRSHRPTAAAVRRGAGGRLRGRRCASGREQPLQPRERLPRHERADLRPPVPVRSAAPGPLDHVEWSRAPPRRGSVVVDVEETASPTAIVGPTAGRAGEGPVLDRSRRREGPAHAARDAPGRLGEHDRGGLPVRAGHGPPRADRMAELRKGGAETLVGRAVYTNFRRFQVDTSFEIR